MGDRVLADARREIGILSNTLHLRETEIAQLRKRLGELARPPAPDAGSRVIRAAIALRRSWLALQTGEGGEAEAITAFEEAHALAWHHFDEAVDALGGDADARGDPAGQPTSITIDWEDRVARDRCPCGGEIAFDLTDAYYATRGVCAGCGRTAWLDWRLRLSQPNDGEPPAKHQYAVEPAPPRPDSRRVYVLQALEDGGAVELRGVFTDLDHAKHALEGKYPNLSAWERCSDRPDCWRAHTGKHPVLIEPAVLDGMPRPGGEAEG